MSLKLILQDDISERAVKGPHQFISEVNTETQMPNKFQYISKMLRSVRLD
jgi:hypothetical protein